MTISFAWIRQLRDCEELVFASDSRLSGDARMVDCAPKIVTLPRSDAAVAFAGYTGDAYPLMHQLALAIDSHAPLRLGLMDIATLKTHALKIFDGMSRQISSDHKELLAPDATILLGGYSWIRKHFMLWSIRYLDDEKRFDAQPARWAVYATREGRVVLRNSPSEESHIPIGQIAIAGDQGKVGWERLSAWLSAKRTFALGVRQAGFDMEPFCVLRDMLRDPRRSHTIGGAPQVVKVYQYMRAAPLGVFWPSREAGTAVIQGRTVLPYERPDRWILDPDTLVSESPLYTRKDEEDAAEEARVADT